MGATQRGQSLQAQPKILKKLSEPQIYQSGRKKDPKIRMGATRRNLQGQLKILNKSSKHQINQSEQKFTQKTYV
jgi:hypothetical protein